MDARNQALFAFFANKDPMLDEEGSKEEKWVQKDNMDVAQTD